MVVLVIDDESDMRELWKADLESAEITIVEASNGLEGLALLRSRPIDAVVSDIIMPQLNGIQFLIEAVTQFPQLPIFLVTGGLIHDEAQILAFGARSLGDKSVAHRFRVAAQIRALATSQITVKWDKGTDPNPPPTENPAAPRIAVNGTK